MKQEGDEEVERPFYSDSESESEESDSGSSGSEGSGGGAKKAKRGPMDADHRLLLNSVKPLLLSRNSAVCYWRGSPCPPLPM